MSDLKKMMQDAIQNDELKKALQNAEADVKKELNPGQEIGEKDFEKIQDVVINIGKKFGYNVTREDFDQNEEGELDENDLAAVAGGMAPDFVGCCIIAGNNATDNRSCWFCGRVYDIA